MRRYLKYLKNKYLIVSVIMIGWLLFFDDNNLIYRYNAETKLNKLEQDHAYYKMRIGEMRERHDQLSNDPEALERYAREHYLMKRPEEDLYIITD